MKKVKFCKDCKWSRHNSRSSYDLRCINDQVVSEYPWALSRWKDPNEDTEYNYGTGCHEERSKKSWFAPCGIKGKLWEERKKAIIPPGDE